MRLTGAASLLLGWRPEDFWNATPAELATALNGVAASEPVDGDTIEALRRRFPD